jgi:glycosyltransferase involved in cell wall biosynthesis
MRLTVIIPCFNEVSTIVDVVDAVEKAPLPTDWSKEIVVVNDGSSDGTTEALQGLGEREGVRVLHRDENGGKGAALKDGLRASWGDYVVVQDADKEYNPDDIAALLQPIIAGEADSVFGSRILRNNNVPYNAVYFYGGLLVTKIFNIAFGTRFSDIATCYKVFPRAYIAELIRSSHDDFVFDALDLTYVLSARGRVKEVPISYTARTKSTGKKLNWINGVEIVMAIVLARLGVGLENRNKAMRFLRFFISGGTSAVVNFALLYLFTEFGHVWYLLSSALAFILAFGVSFFMQKYWTFRSRDAGKIKRQLPQHLLLAVFNLGLNLVLIFSIVEYLHIWYMLAAIISNLLIAFESFFAFKWIFR